MSESVRCLLVLAVRQGNNDNNDGVFAVVSVVSHVPLQDNLAPKTHRDTAKEEDCRQLGITLIPIPQWWDQTPESLMATIHARRPDIFPDCPASAVPIPEIPVANAVFYGKTMGSRKLPLFMLSNTYQSDLEPTGWYAYERGGL